MGGGEERRKRGEEEDDEEEEDKNGGRGMEAWQRAYADERSWEALQEDESDLLRPVDTKTLAHAQYRRRLLLRSAVGSYAFIRGFFDQNSLSHIGMVTIKDGVAQRLTDLAGSPDSQIKSLLSKLECSGDSFMQNAMELAYDHLSQIPPYGHREVLILYSALNTCDLEDIMETIQKCKKAT